MTQKQRNAARFRDKRPKDVPYGRSGAQSYLHEPRELKVLEEVVGQTHEDEGTLCAPGAFPWGKIGSTGLVSKITVRGSVPNPRR